MPKKISESFLQILTLTYKEEMPDLTQDKLKAALDMVRAGQKQPEPDRLVSAVEGARLLGVSRRTFDRISSTGRISKVVLTRPHTRIDGREVGGSVRFRLSEVMAVVAGRV